ncbi:hypothetical protein LJR219_001906 [Phenylobacterium sp. LjRoot219]|uniref:hypothetical protein n=1 Tax=Phenylobacterium sp. LjRoot219 TaxID=3342283 RepID=UPI003ECF411D
MDDYRYWHFKAAEALAARDIAAARTHYLSGAALGMFDQDNPRDHALRLAVAHHDGNQVWLAEAEASLARNRHRWPAGSVEREATVAAHHLCGLMRLGEPQMAAGHFAAALELAAGFLPARVELEILRTGRDRQALFASLGAVPDRQDWRYALAASELGATLGPVSDGETAAAAICLRGLCTPETPALVRLYRALNPSARIFVATWEQTPPDLVAALRDSAEVVLVPDTDRPGRQNRNRQLLLARAVLAAAQREGKSYVLLTRTDLALFQPGILSSLLALHRTFPVRPGRLFGRIVAPDVWTRRYMPFHVSDIMSFGALPDLVLQWGAAFDEADEPVGTEQYLHWRLHGALGLPPVEPDLAAYRSFLRDYFIIRDLDWFGGLWLRNPDLRNAASVQLRDSCVSQTDWERLYYQADPAPHLDLMGASANGVMLQSALGLLKYG